MPPLTVAGLFFLFFDSSHSLLARPRGPARRGPVLHSEDLVSRGSGAGMMNWYSI